MSRGENEVLGFRWIKTFEEDFYPGWMTKKPKLLFSTALAGEVGEVCGVVTHLEGGGTNNQNYTPEMLLHQTVDAYVQLLLLVQRYGFSEADFSNEFETVKRELTNRLLEKGAST